MCDDIVPVLFRTDRAGPFKGQVTAVFPTLAADNAARQMTCYAHVGQHSGCTYGWYLTTRPATPAEYASLKAELEGAPYRYKLDVRQRITTAMRSKLREQRRAA